MPEMRFKIRWPDGTTEDCYSPSLVIKDHLETGRAYPLAEFRALSRTALSIASERVRAKYGFPCSSALAQIDRIDAGCRRFEDRADAAVGILSFQEWFMAGSLPSSVPVAVVGGGQAGLSLSHHLTARGIGHVVFERSTAMHVWSERRWDNFSLVTPNWQCDLPGHSYDGPDPDGFMKKGEILDYLAAFREKVGAPLREGTAVTRVVPRPEGGFLVETSAGAFHADQVVAASGGYTVPIMPPFAADLPAAIVQVHSEQYRNAAQLPPGPVLVVGSGQSGAQIAEDLHLAGRRVHLAVGGAPRCARFYRGRDVVTWLADMNYYDMPVEAHPLREGVRDNTNHYVTGRDGGRDIDLRRFALEGMRLYGQLDGHEDGTLRFLPTLKENLDEADRVYNGINASIDRFIAQNGIEAPPPSVYVPLWQPEADPTSLDLEAEGIAAVVWCIGFRPDFGWLQAPVFDDHGHPTHRRGVTGVDGLYFLGLPWLHTWGSGRFSSVGRDAAYLAELIEGAAVPTRTLPRVAAAG